MCLPLPGMTVAFDETQQVTGRVVACAIHRITQRGVCLCSSTNTGITQSNSMLVCFRAREPFTYIWCSALMRPLPLTFPSFQEMGGFVSLLPIRPFSTNPALQVDAESLYGCRQWWVNDLIRRVVQQMSTAKGKQWFRGRMGIEHGAIIGEAN